LFLLFVLLYVFFFQKALIPYHPRNDNQCTNTTQQFNFQYISNFVANVTYHLITFLYEYYKTCTGLRLSYLVRFHAFLMLLIDELYCSIKIAILAEICKKGVISVEKLQKSPGVFTPDGFQRLGAPLPYPRQILCFETPLPINYLIMDNSCIIAICRTKLVGFDVFVVLLSVLFRLLLKDGNAESQ